LKIAGAAPAYAEPTPRDWLLLAALTVQGGSSFAMIRVAVETLEPATVAAARLWTGTILLLAIMFATGRRLPPLMTDGRIDARWRWMSAYGAIGYAVPFFLFPWGQQVVPSGLAGIYMAFMPLATIALAHFFADERMTARKGAGFAAGFAGVLLLIGPEAIRGAGNGSALAQGAILLASFCYAVGAILSRRAPQMQARSFSAGALLVAALVSTPGMLIFGAPGEGWTAGSAFAVLGLGVFPTGLNALVIILIIRSAGASFMSFANYLTPPLAVALGAVFFGERLDPLAFAALGVILAGLAASRTKGKAAGAS